MKKLVLTLGLILTTTFCYADGVVDLGQYINVGLNSIPVTKHGVAYSTIDHNFNYVALTELMQYKGFSLDAGYAGRAKETGDKIIGAVSLKLLNMNGIIPMPILRELSLEPMAYIGVGRVTGSNELDFGVGATVLKLKF